MPGPGISFFAFISTQTLIVCDKSRSAGFVLPLSSQGLLQTAQGFTSLSAANTPWSARSAAVAVAAAFLVSKPSVLVQVEIASVFNGVQTPSVDIALREGRCQR